MDMASKKTLLDELRSQSHVDCDTLDEQVAELLGPFVDGTSNQAIAFAEIQKPKNETLLLESIELAKELHSQYAKDVSLEQLAVEVIMVKLSARIATHLTGTAHIQTNPYNAYSPTKTLLNAQRIISIYKHVKPGFNNERICIKIPSTWEGIQACRKLEKSGINTLATTVFSMEQVALAADAGCKYIAPYINELKVHFIPGYIDTDKGLTLCRSAQKYYETINAKTKIMPASLTSTAEVLRLAGLHHITVSPLLLADLASTPSSLSSADASAAWIDQQDIAESVEIGLEDIVGDEAAYRMAYTRGKHGANERKLTDAVNIFADMQDGMEALVKKYVG